MQTFTTPPVHFLIEGLPKGLQVTITVNGKKYMAKTNTLRLVISEKNVVNFDSHVIHFLTLKTLYRCISVISNIEKKRKKYTI